MPIICFKNKIKINNFEETVSFAFNCIYDNNYHLKLKNYSPNYFDCGDFRIKIDEAINKLNYDILMKYEHKNGGILYMAFLNYFYDEIPSLYSIKFESTSGDSIYYVNELKNKNNTKT
jgi:hypothetical protein